MADNIEKLEWTSSVSYGPNHSGEDWISVVPPNGSGSQTVQIRVTPSNIFNDPDTAGTVTFFCTSCDPQITKTINVTRCTPDCEYEPQGTKQYTYKEWTVDKCDTSITFSVPYTETRQPTVQGCDPKIINGSEEVTLNFLQNETTESRVVGEVAGKYKVTQLAGPCTVIPCGCDKLTVAPSSYHWDWNDTTQQTIYISKDECITNVSISPETSTYFNISKGNNTITVSPKGQYTEEGASDRTQTITVSYRGDSNCSSSITLSQSSKDAPTPCPCSYLTASTGSCSWAWNETDDKTVTFGVTDSCLPFPTINQTEIGDFILTPMTAGKFKVRPNGQNTSETTPRTGKITLQSTSDCSLTINLTQGKKETCSYKIVVSPNPVTCNDNTISAQATKN